MKHSYPTAIPAIDTVSETKMPEAVPVPYWIEKGVPITLLEELEGAAYKGAAGGQLVQALEAITKSAEPVSITTLKDFSGVPIFIPPKNSLNKNVKTVSSRK